jgi:putative spermidine/putrescine transport system substrate-binding protein
MSKTKPGFAWITRRRLMATTASALGAAAIGFPAPYVKGQTKKLKVAVYGGYFKDSFDKHIFPDFVKESRIDVESVAEPTGEAWLVQLEQAARAGQAPADVSMMAQVARLKGQESNLWQAYDVSKLPNASNLLPQFVQKYPDGRTCGVGAVAWFITLCTNTKVYPQAPTSWAELWNPAQKDRLGLLALVSNSFLLEITAATFFGGLKVLDTEDGTMQCFRKLSEVKPNVKLWYRDEGQFQAALQAGEVPMGQYYHDVTGLAASQGHPVRSTFPKEGGVNDSGSWAVTKASKAIDEAHVFINYMCRPDIQAKLSRNVGTAPTVPRDLAGLSDKEFAAVSSDVTPIIPRYDIYLKRSDWLNQKWTEMIAG